LQCVAVCVAEYVEEFCSVLVCSPPFS